MQLIATIDGKIVGEHTEAERQACHGDAKPPPREQEEVVERQRLTAYRLALADGVKVTDDEEILVVRSVYMESTANPIPAAMSDTANM